MIVAALGYAKLQTTNAAELIQASEQARIEEIQIINQSHAKELSAKDKIIAAKDQRIEELDLNYRKALWALKKERKEREEELANEEPDKIKEQIIETYGIQYVDPKTGKPVGDID